MGVFNYTLVTVSLIKKDAGDAFLIHLDDGWAVLVLKSDIAFPEHYHEGDTNCVMPIAEWFVNKECL